MKLNFTGRGAMLYPKEGNTAAYFESNNTFFLIDCGEDVAHKLIEKNKLASDKEYYLMVTHTHSDHIGSLGTLQQYLYWCCGKKLNIVISEQMKYQRELQQILDGFGLVPDTYNLVDETSLDDKFSEFKSIRYVSSNHGDTPLKSCSIIIRTNQGNILYTGDIADDTILREFIIYNGAHNIDKIYTDVSLNKSPVHLSLDELDNAVPRNIKSKINCMHINDARLISLIEARGYKLVQVSPLIDDMDIQELEQLQDNLRVKLEEVKQKIKEKRKI